MGLIEDANESAASCELTGLILMPDDTVIKSELVSISMGEISTVNDSTSDAPRTPKLVVMGTEI